MKVEMDNIDGCLAIIVNKRYIKTIEDKEILIDTIDAICNLQCFTTDFSMSDLDKVIKGNKGIYIAFTANHKEGLCSHNYLRRKRYR